MLWAGNLRMEVPVRDGLEAAAMLADSLDYSCIGAGTDMMMPGDLSLGDTEIK